MSANTKETNESKELNAKANAKKQQQKENQKNETKSQAKENQKNNSQQQKSTTTASGEASKKQPKNEASVDSSKKSKQDKSNQPASIDQSKEKASANNSQVSQTTSILTNKEFSTAKDTIQLKKKSKTGTDGGGNNKGFKLFNHLQYQCDFTLVEKLPLDNPQIHPAFIKLGLKYANQTISGSNSRCLGFLHAFKEFIRDYKPSKDCTDFGKDLESKLKPNINFLAQCRPLSVSMGNAIKEFKQILQYQNETNESDLKKLLFDEIEKFVDERVELADLTISKFMLAHENVVISGSSYSKSKITDEDCILIYGCSSLVIQVLCEAHKKFKNFKVIVVDARPKCTGKTTLEKLVKKGIDCTYILINAVSFVMKRVTKVIIGAHALLANGYVMGSVGASQIALIAKAFNVPLVVCCETYKFCDKVQTDVFVNNELGNPDDLKLNKLKKSSTKTADIDNENNMSHNINRVNLVYDVTPPDLISCVVTDMGMLPCTSVPVVLRVKNRENIHLMQNINKTVRE